MKHMKRMFQPMMAALLLLFITGATSCKKKMKDSDLQTAVETALKANPELANAIVTVKDGVATLSGELPTDAAKTALDGVLTGMKDLKSFANNCTVAPPPAPVVPEVTDQLASAVTDALKDFPTVKSELKEGVLTLTGEIQRSSMQKLMMGLNALKAMGLKKIESAGLVKK
jgi:hyperosmotically inducible periplasmic protein